MPQDENELQQPTGAAAVSAKGFNLPEPLLAVLPSDPFDQLDVARKITSIALATRLTNLEDELDGLRRAIGDRDDIISDLRAQLHTLDSTLGDLSGQLARAQEEKEILLNENGLLSNSVNKLNREVSKLEVFKKTLMLSLQEESGSPQVGASRMPEMQIWKASSLSSGSLLGEEDSSNPPPKSPSASETGYANSYNDDFGDVDASKYGALHSLDLPSHHGTPRLTPSSPPALATGLTPKNLSRPLSPRRHSISVSSTRNTSDNRPGSFSPVPAIPRNSMTSPFDTGEQTVRSRADGKEFFRQVRSRLSYEQFSAFLSNVKELNSQKQTRGETLRKADEIFGPHNKDLYTIFEGLINRNLH